MRNIKMCIMYDGAGFGGWQRLGNQDSALSIQGELEKNLSVILKENIKVIGSGRTDAGVHAYGQVANFHTNSQMSLDMLKQKLNYYFFDALVITDIEEVANNFHSRYSAISKTYEYHIDIREKACVFTRRYSVSAPGPIQIEQMKEASKLLIGEHDFAGFSSVKRQDMNTIRRINWIEIYVTGDMLHVIINGNGFLYNMVRIIVGTLLEVGKGNRDIQTISTILLTKDRELAGPTLSSQGLFLKQVYY